MIGQGVWRRAVLKGIEFLRSQGKKDKDLESSIKQLLDKHMKVRSVKPMVYSERRTERQSRS
jgi:hypothetical protein